MTDQLVIEITDTGIGLPEDRERLTEPYMTTRVRGTGLGLAIVKKIVEEHMGEIAFRRGAGANLTSGLPSMPIGWRPWRPTSCSSRLPAGEDDEYGDEEDLALMALEVLVVDDEADIRELVAGVLEDEGYAVRSAADSGGALDAIDDRRPSLVLLDVWLQGSKLDGLQLLEQIKRRIRPCRC